MLRLIIMNIFSACRRRYRGVTLRPWAGTGWAWGFVQPALERAFGRWFPVTSALLRTLSLPGGPAPDWAFRQRHPGQRRLHSPGVGPRLWPEPWAGERQQGIKGAAERGEWLPPAAFVRLVRLVPKQTHVLFSLNLNLIYNIDEWGMDLFSIIYKGREFF